MRRLQIGESFIIVLSLLLLADEEGVILYFALAAALHELGHYLAMRLCGGQLLRLSLTAAGAVMQYRMGAGAVRRGVIAAAGPVFSLLGWLVAAWCGAYAFAGASLLLGLFNLLPVLPLDGGTLVSLALSPAGHVGYLLSRGVSLGCAALVLLAGAWLASHGGGLTLAAGGAMLLVSQKGLQIPWKRDTMKLS